VTVGAEVANADLDPERTAFLNALNTGDALAEAVAYLDAGGDINAAIVPMINQAMLHYAAIEQRVALIEILAERGADLDIRNAFGMTPMHLAATHEIDAALMRGVEPDFLCAQTLCRLGASLDATDQLGRTPRDIAKMYGPAMLDLFDEVIS
jgi:hypothetical protein